MSLLVLDKSEIKTFQNKVLRFYKEKGRKLPWRETLDPYKIHVSEIMLQQTQVERVKEYYKNFLEKYPSVKTLSQADTKELLELWQGLGYNNRALRLRESAKVICKEFNGEYPKELNLLESLPGIGPYTSAAILAFAFNKDVCVVDTNIRRILIHEFKLDERIKEKDLKVFAEQLIVKGQSRNYHNALMDYGALELTARKTGIQSLSKQGKFLGSTRWVRSQILKELLKKEFINLATLQEQFKEHELLVILEKMQKDKLLLLKEEHIELYRQT